MLLMIFRKMFPYVFEIWKIMSSYNHSFHRSFHSRFN